MFAVSFPSIFSFAVLLHHSSYFFFSVLSVSIYFAPCWQSYFEWKWMVHITWWCSCSSALTSPARLAVWELQKMQSTNAQGMGTQNLLCCHHDSGSFSSDVFRTLGCQWEETENKRKQREKGLQENIWVTNDVPGNKFGMTVLHGQGCLWSARGDLLEQWCGLFLARKRSMKRKLFWRMLFLSFLNRRDAA